MRIYSSFVIHLKYTWYLRTSSKLRCLSKDYAIIANVINVICENFTRPFFSSSCWVHFYYSLRITLCLDNLWKFCGFRVVTFIFIFFWKYMKRYIHTYMELLLTYKSSKILYWFLFILLIFTFYLMWILSNNLYFLQKCR